MIPERPFLMLAFIITSTILSVYLGFKYGLLGVALAYYWFWYVCAVEGLRILGLLPKRSYDGNTASSKKATDEYIESIEDKDLH